MSAEFLLGIDLGTGSCRAVIFTADGTQVASDLREWTHPGVEGVPGSQDFDTTSNWSLVCTSVQTVLARSRLRPDQIAAVSATAMREGMVLYDRSGQEVWACPNVDSRADAEARDLIDEGTADQIFAIAGDWVSITAPSRLRWLSRHRPDILARTAHVTMLSDWVVYRLTGTFVTDPTIGSSSALFDLRERTWSTRLLDLVGVDPAIVPPVAECGTSVGEVTATAAVDTGLRAGTPVVLGGADTQLGLIGLADGRPGAATVVGGTFWQTTAVVDRALIDPHRRLRTLCHAVPDQWMIEGIGFYCGTVMRWVRDTFCESEQAIAVRRGVDAYTVMEETASAIAPGSNGVIGIFTNIMNTSRWVHASPAFLQLDVDSPTRTSRAALIRAAEESAAYAARGHADIIAEVTGSPLSRIVFTGGGANGHLWAQILADVTNLPVSVPRVKESTALGAALLASVAVGLHPDLGAATKAAVHLERTHDPDPQAAATYQHLFEQWLRIYPRMLNLTEAEHLRPLWRPAGA